MRTLRYREQDYRETAEFLKARTGPREVGIVLGTGFGALEDLLEVEGCLSYQEIPGFCSATAPSHAGRLLWGTSSGKRVVVLSGRLHGYEGYTPEEVAYPLRVLRLLGVTVAVLTNGTGCLRPDWCPGEYMLITGHLSFGMESPCTGENLDLFGPRFFDLSDVWSRRFFPMAHEAAQETGVTLRQGVYAYMPGPQYETPQEVQALRQLGADCVGMSTVQEAAAAAHAGIELLGISHLANYAAGITDAPVDCDVVMNDKVPIKNIIKRFLSKL